MHTVRIPHGSNSAGGNYYFETRGRTKSRGPHGEQSVESPQH
ncbi:hypothetical protein AG1IA_10104 [Rhizoctonia solani AG-1 IA]|uniref:Uncharacterized protein n=1 Tax=Thanatephorus cucumeris (strain AG1-IA) TaxID=983506 RepID=L8WCH7_THACA|nr:hypothetical protein AG1IA_10104 [Rhizoctonia solani AG-1 IA]